MSSLLTCSDWLVLSSKNVETSLGVCACVRFYLHANFLCPVSSTVRSHLLHYYFFFMCSLMFPPALGFVCVTRHVLLCLALVPLSISYSGSSREYGGEIVRKGFVRYGAWGGKET